MQALEGLYVDDRSPETVRRVQDLIDAFKVVREPEPEREVKRYKVVREPEPEFEAKTYKINIV
jgi:hypothetical protein